MSDSRQYINLNLELRDLNVGDDTFQVTMLPSPVGESQQSETVPYALGKLQDALESLEQKVISKEDMIGLGQSLTEKLLPPGQVRELFLDALNKAGRDGGVRLRLLIREPKLAQLPWEFAYLRIHEGEEDRRHFLCLNPQISIVRHEALGEAQPSLAGAAPERLRLVVATVNVKGQYKLKLKKERQVIERALKNFKVDGVSVEFEPFIENATAGDLAAALQQKANIFHFAGHGVFSDEGEDDKSGETKGAGYLVLAKDKEGKEPYMFPSGELAALLQGAGVRVALLGACETGRRDGVSAWTGVATSLVERGIPAVVAMQYEVLDNAAISFSEMFYTALAAGLSIDEAVAAGRQAMLRESSEEDVEWGVPVLYMRSTDGVIFPKLAERKVEAAARVRRLIELRIKTLEGGATAIGSKGRSDANVLVDINEVKGPGTTAIGEDTTTQDSTTVVGKDVDID